MEEEVKNVPKHLMKVVAVTSGFKTTINPKTKVIHHSPTVLKDTFVDYDQIENVHKISLERSLDKALKLKD